MRIAFSLAREWTLLGLLATFLVAPLNAQTPVRIPPAAMVRQASIEDLLRRGEVMEQEHSWAKALSHYEEALRDYPEQRELQQRLDLARAHVDIARRYADTSYVKSLNQLTEQQALDLYAEVLLKIDTYHVNNPNWGYLIYRGVLNLRVARSEAAFVDCFPQPVATGAGDQFVNDVKGITDFNNIENRYQARDLAAAIAQTAVRDLQMTKQAAVFEFTCAAAQSLDQYSTYLTGAQLDEVFSQIEGNFVGLGVELKADHDTLLIVNVIPGGPAEEGGILANDRIVEVDGRSMREMSTDKAADMLKGPEHSFVDLVMQSPTGTLRKLRLQRRRVEVPSVQNVQMLDRTAGVAYMKLTSFQKTTSRDVDNGLWAMHREGMRSLIIDLRGNPGGLLNSSVEIADKFLTAGTIVSTRGRSAREDFDYQAHDVGTWRVPLVVLIDGDSASASEILAGAIRDHHRGTVVGQRSYGKGSVQGIFPLSRYKSGIRLTTAKFYSPSGQEISHRGVTPEIIVSRNAGPAEAFHQVARPTSEGELVAATGNDMALEAALDAARRSTDYQVRRAQ